jgi:hypothetical protein
MLKKKQANSKKPFQIIQVNRHSDIKTFENKKRFEKNCLNL